MRILAALFIGFLIGCLVVAGLVMFKNAAWAKAEQWSRQNPPPPVTPARRMFLRTGNFIASYWLLSAPLIVLFSAGLAALVAARRPKTPT